MKRIGIAASHIAKDDLVLYNVFVLILSFLFSLLIFCISAFSILAGIVLTSYVTRGFMAIDPGAGSFKFAFFGLVVLVVLINLAAILVNVKLKR